MNFKKPIQFLFILMLFSPLIATARPESKPLEPFRIAGNLYYVGDDYQADYLIVTSQGNILINTGYEEDVQKIKDSIKKLGLNYQDIKVLLISHAHGDHSGGAALVKQETGAKYMVMEGDVSVVETGGKTDFHYGKESDPDNFFKPVHVDRVLHDGEEVKLGETTLIAHHTGGHTKGCTTWTMKVKEKGKQLNVVIVGGPFVNPGYQLLNNVEYPDIAKDYQHTFQVLKTLQADIFLGAHGMYYNLAKKLGERKTLKANPFIDPKGYQKFVAMKADDFYKELASQRLLNASSQAS